MAIDTSVIAAILFKEPERDAFVARIEADPVRLVSTATLIEAALVVEARKGPAGAAELDDLVRAGELRPTPVTVEHVALAREGWRRFGRGRHPAGFNLGDCFAYALTRGTGERLLFKGEDFARTDVVAAARPGRGS